MPKKKEPKVITKPLLRQLNDHAGGGFILFNFDAEGLPEIHSNFDDHPHALALQCYVKSWGDALNMVTMEAMSQNLFSPESDEIQGEDDESEEEI